MRHRLTIEYGRLANFGPDAIGDSPLLGALSSNGAPPQPDESCLRLSVSWGRSRIPEFIKAGRTIGAHRAGIDAALDRGLSNGRHEGLNTKVRLLIRSAYGFHSAQAALALVLLACRPVTLALPYHTGGHLHS